MLIEAAGPTISGRAVLAPQMALFMYTSVAGFGVAAYLTRAIFRCAISSLPAGVVFAGVWMIKLKVDYAMGWWRSIFPDTPDSLMLFSVPLMFLILMFGGGVLFLVSWRVTRRSAGQEER